MLVKDWMTKKSIVVSPKTSVGQAMRTMRQHRVRHLPVVAEDKTLVGVVTQTDLLQASPSPATSLSVWEINFLLAKMEVRDAMTKKVVVVSEDCPLEEAALVMGERKIGCLPVVQGRRLVGIITETDLFTIFTEQLGARSAGLRLMVLIPDVKGEMARLAECIAKVGGNIVRLTTLPAEDPANQVVTVKVEDVPQETLVAAVSKAVLKILDVRQVRRWGTDGYTPCHWILEA